MPSVDPRNPEFWREHGDSLWRAVAELAFKSLAAGAAGGEALLPEAIRQLISWDVLNQAAVDYLRFYRHETMFGINNTTANQAVRAINEWMDAGEPLDVLQARFEPIFGPGRAKTIATTEVTRLYSRGNQLAWTAGGFVRQNRWMTRRNEMVCPVCSALDGLVAPIGDAFEIPPERMTQEMARMLLQGDITGPPAHPNCYCWLTPVITEEDIERRSREAAQVWDELV